MGCLEENWKYKIGYKIQSNRKKPELNRILSMIKVRPFFDFTRICRCSQLFRKKGKVEPVSTNIISFSSLWQYVIKLSHFCLNNRKFISIVTTSPEMHPSNRNTFDLGKTGNSFSNNSWLNPEYTDSKLDSTNVLILISNSYLILIFILNQFCFRNGNFQLKSFHFHLLSIVQ